MNLKKLFLLTLFALFVISCQNEKKMKETETVKSETADNNEKFEQIFGEFKLLYSELLEFKDEKDFQEFGFGVGGVDYIYKDRPYYHWLQSVEKLKNNPDSSLLMEKGILISELEQLGLAYASSKGKETEVTKRLNKNFSDAITQNQ